MTLIKKLKQFTNRKKFWVEEVLNTMNYLNKNTLPELKIWIGTEENNVIKQVKSTILRIDNNIPCFKEKIKNAPEKIITCSYWHEGRNINELYRIVIKNRCINGIIIDIGINLESLDQVYEEIANYITSRFTLNYKITEDPFKFNYDKGKFPMLTWQNDKSYFFMNVLWSNPINYNRNEIIKKYISFDNENMQRLRYEPWKIDDLIEGMFVIKNSKILPTISILVTENSEVRDDLHNYLIYSMQRFPS